MNTDLLAVTSLQDLLQQYAGKFTSGEVQLKNSLTAWIDKASALALKNILRHYQRLVDKHVNLLLQYHARNELKTLPFNDIVMEAFIKDTNNQLVHCTDNAVLDACLVASMQSINHYKISLYGTAAAYARSIGDSYSASLFYEAKYNESEIDLMLTRLADTEVNLRARSPETISAGN